MQLEYQSKVKYTPAKHMFDFFVDNFYLFVIVVKLPVNLTADSEEQNIPEERKLQYKGVCTECNKAGYFTYLFDIIKEVMVIVIII